MNQQRISIVSRVISNGSLSEEVGVLIDLGKIVKDGLPGTCMEEVTQMV